jgi:hypothetical protein
VPRALAAVLKVKRAVTERIGPRSGRRAATTCAGVAA